MIDASERFGMIEKLEMELSSARNYLDLAQEEQDHAEMLCLLAIADDEYQHAEFLKSLIQEKGFSVPEPTAAEMTQIKSTLRKFRK